MGKTLFFYSLIVVTSLCIYCSNKTWILLWKIFSQCTEQTSCSLEARSIYQVSFHNCNTHTHTAITPSTWQLQIEHWNSESPGEWMSTSCCRVSISIFGDPFNSFLTKYLILCYTTGYKWYSHQLKTYSSVVQWPTCCHLDAC